MPAPRLVLREIWRPSRHATDKPSRMGRRHNLTNTTTLAISVLGGMQGLHICSRPPEPEEVPMDPTSATLKGCFMLSLSCFRSCSTYSITMKISSRRLPTTT